MILQQARLIDAQVAVLGSILLDDDCAAPVMSKVRDVDFADSMYRDIYMAMRELFFEATPIDPVLVMARLKPLGREAEFRNLLRQIMEATPTAANCSLYVDILLEESKLHRAKLALGADDAQTLDELRQLLRGVDEIVNDRPRMKVLTMQDGLMRFLDQQAGRVKADYLTWGFSDLDAELYVESGDFVVLGGYPSDGKTALAMQFACHISRTRRVGFFSLETKDKKLFERMMAHVARLGLPIIKRQEMSERDFEHVASLSARITEQNLEFVEAAGYTTQEIQSVAVARRYDVIFIDYLQLIPSAGRRTPNRAEEVGQISRELHTMAQRHGIVTVALSQLNRPDKAATSRDGRVKAPSMSNFRESGQIEQDADVALLLYRDKPDYSRSPRWLKIGKNKDGERDSFLLDFDGKHQTFTRSYRKAVQATDATDKDDEPDYQLALTELPPDSDLPFEEGGLFS